MTDYYEQTCIAMPLREGDREYVEKLLEDWQEWAEDADDPCEKGFNTNITNTTRYNGKECSGLLIIEEDGSYLNIENVVNFLQCFMRDRWPGEVFGFTWSYGASKPVPDQFGGGACVIDSKENAEFFRLDRWMQDMKEHLGGKNYKDASVPH